MNSQALQKPDELAATYLQQMQELAFEISVATDAIATNALATLQESVAKQEMLCANLAILANEFGDGSAASEQLLPPCNDAAINGKIRAARRAIVELNLQYAALLEHSGKSITLLISLCKSHTGRSQEARGLRLKQQTWSCEM